MHIELFIDEMGWLIDLWTRIKAVYIVYQGKTGSARTDILSAAKALALSEPMAIFHPGDGKSWLVNLTYGQSAAIYGNLGQSAYADYLTYPLSFKLIEDKANHLLMSVNILIKP